MCSSFRGEVKADTLVGVVDCATPHRFELLARAQVAGAAGEAYPGLEEIRDRARTACDGPPEMAAVGSKPRFIMAPADEASWNAGGRLVQCGVTSLGETGAS